MSKYPKTIGPVIWLYFVLFLAINSKTGKVTTTIKDLSKESGISETLIAKTLKKLVKHGFIGLKTLATKPFVITLRHYGT